VSVSLPPLNPLRTFDVAARHSSFSGAANELSVTQAAVSRQIGLLEHVLNVRLFHREKAGVRLTSAGLRFHQEVAPAFALIASATARLTAEQKGEPLRLRVYTTFAAKWLIPRLQSFHAAYPHIQIKISNAVAPVDFEIEELDLAIQFGAGSWPGTESEKLFDDVLQPVCSPSLAAKLRKPDDLKRFQLLHSHYRRADWADWLTQIGRPELVAPGMTFPSSVLTYEAASKGVGVAMGQMTLLRDDVASGALVPLFDRPIERPLAHYAVWPKDRRQPRKVKEFLSWIRRELKTGPTHT